MFDKLFGGFGGCGCHEKRECNTSCDVLWIIILLLVLFNGGLFGLDICTLIILFVIFGGNFLGGRCGCDKKERC
jgi:hypothetical protein